MLVRTNYTLVYAAQHLYLQAGKHHETKSLCQICDQIQVQQTIVFKLRDFDFRLIFF